MSNNRFGFEASQWAAIKLGPLHVLRLVGGADSLIDRAEWTSLIDAVRVSSDHGDDLVQSVMRELAQELEEGDSFSSMDGDDAVEGLRGITAILASLPVEGTRFREMLLELGATVAESSGAQLTRTFALKSGSATWGRSAGTSAREREALALVAEALGLA